MRNETVDTFYLKSSDSVYKIKIKVKGSYTYYVWSSGFRLYQKNLEKIKRKELMQFDKRDKKTYADLKPKSEKTWLKLLDMPTSKFITQGEWEKGFQFIDALPPTKGTLPEKSSLNGNLRQLTIIAATDSKKANRSRALNLIFEYWGEDGKSAIEFLKNIKNRKLIFNLFYSGAKYQLTGFEELARQLLFQDPKDSTWESQFSAAAKLYAGVYLNRVSEGQTPVFTQINQFLFEILQFMMKVAESGKKPQLLEISKPTQLLSIMNGLLAAQCPAGAICFGMTCINAGLNEASLWKLIGVAYETLGKRTGYGDSTKEIIEICNETAIMVANGKSPPESNLLVENFQTPKQIFGEFFTLQGIERPSYRHHKLANSQFFPVILSAMPTSNRLEYLQELLSKFDLMLHSQEFQHTKIGGMLRLPLKVAEILPSPEVVGFFAIFLDKYFVSTGSTGYMTRRVMRTWKIWAKSNPENFIRSVGTFLALYPPIDTFYAKDLKEFAMDLSKTPVAPPPDPELATKARERLMDINDGMSFYDKRDILTEILSYGELPEVFLVRAKVDPADPDSYLMKAVAASSASLQTWLEAAKIARRRKKLKYLFGALAKYPESADIFFQIAEIFNNEHQINKALNYLRRAIELDPQNVDYLYEYAKWSSARRKDPSNIILLKKVIEIQPSNEKAATLLADLEKSATGLSHDEIIPGDLQIAAPELPFNYLLVRILMGQSVRLVNKFKQIKLGKPSLLDESYWETREEIFPEIWDNALEVVWQILEYSKNAIVRDFSLRILKQSPIAQDFFSFLSIDRMIHVATYPHPHTQAMLIPILRERLSTLPEIPIAYVEMLVNSDFPIAWQLAVGLIEEKHIDVPMQLIAALCCKPDLSVSNFCSILIGEKDVDYKEELTKEIASFIIYKNIDPAVLSQSVYPLFQNGILNVNGNFIRILLQSELEQLNNFIVTILKDLSPVAGLIPIEGILSGVSNPNDEIRQIIFKYIEAGINATGESFSQGLYALTALLWSPYEDAFKLYKDLSEDILSRGQEAAALLLEHFINQLDKGTISAQRKDEFFALLGKIDITAWKPIDKSVLEMLGKSPDDDFTAFAGLISARLDQSLPPKEIIYLIANSEIGLIRQILIATLLEREQDLMVELTELQPLFESEFDDLFEWAANFMTIIPVNNESKATLIKQLLDSPTRRARNFAFDLLNTLFNGEIPAEIVTRLLEHPELDIRQRLAEILHLHLEEIVQDQPQLAFRYAKSVIFVPNRLAQAKDLIYQFLIQFANSNLKYRKSIKDLLLKIGAGSIIKDRERALLAYVRIEE